MNKWIPRLFSKRSDGGGESGVTGYFLIEWKPVFSIGLLNFSKGSREAFHDHAFHALTWWLKGSVTEEMLEGSERFKYKDFRLSFKPKLTKRDCFHKIHAHISTWALTFRGPWADTWHEWRGGHRLVTLTHGRKVVS